MSQTATAEVSLELIRPVSRQHEPSGRPDQASLQHVSATELSPVRTAVIIATLTGTTVVSSFSNAWALDSLLASALVSSWVEFLLTLSAGELGIISVQQRTLLLLLSVSGVFLETYKNLTACFDDCEMSSIGQVQ
ncbi:MAG: hypothetical protein Q9225_001718 [Loekoesia sp. 1 TL-2023]